MQGAPTARHATKNSIRAVALMEVSITGDKAHQDEIISTAPSRVLHYRYGLRDIDNFSTGAVDGSRSTVYDEGIYEITDFSASRQNRPIA